MAKTLLGLVVLIVLAAAAMAWFGHKTVRTQIVIPAPASAIWKVLTDAAGYKDWNPVFVAVAGDYREGAQITNQVKDGSGKIVEIASTVVALEPERLLNQFGGIRGMITFDHTWRLEPSDGGTRVTQHEEYRGFWVWFWDASWVEPAYAKANEALRDRVLQHTD